MWNLAAYFTIREELGEISAEPEELDYSSPEASELFLRKLELEQRVEGLYPKCMLEIVVGFVLFVLVLSWIV